VSQVGTEAQPLRVAVVGAGPSGFYATEALLKSDVPVCVDLIERLPSPYGLVRSGVAPDHPKLKQAIEVYKKVAEREGFRLLGNRAAAGCLSIREAKAGAWPTRLTILRATWFCLRPSSSSCCRMVSHPTARGT